MFHILWSIIVGFVVGLIARHLLPAVQHMGLIETTLVGIGGSVVGGLIARIFPGQEMAPFFIRRDFLCPSLGPLLCSMSCFITSPASSSTR